MLLFISHYLICYESSRGHKIDGTKPNQTGDAFGLKQGKQTEENGQESSQQRTLSRSTRDRKHKQNHKQQKKQTKGNHIKTFLSRLRKRSSPVSGRIQPRHEDKGKGNGCDTQRNQNTDGGKSHDNQMK